MREPGDDVRVTWFLRARRAASGDGAVPMGSEKARRTHDVTYGLDGVHDPFGLIEGGIARGNVGNERGLTRGLKFLEAFVDAVQR